MSIEYREFRESVRKLAQTKIAPHAADVDDKERFPAESWAALRSNDLPGLAYPESLGGSGADLLAQVIAVEEVAASCASTALVMLVNWPAPPPCSAKAPTNSSNWWYRTSHRAPPAPHGA